MKLKQMMICKRKKKIVCECGCIIREKKKSNILFESVSSNLLLPLERQQSLSLRFGMMVMFVFNHAYK